jgi:zinc/manganese transport system ATP-binding protein
MNELVVKLSHVYTTYTGEIRPTIKDINLVVKSGEFLAVVGPNGSGKTTLIDTLNGLLKISSGEIFVLSEEFTQNPQTARIDIGYIPQDFISPSTTPFLSGDVVLMGRYGKIGLLRNPDERDHEVVNNAMRLLKVDNFAKRPIGRLSGGEQQKIIIARAIAQEPKLMLMDEPFSNLDIESRKDISEKIWKLHKEQNWTTIIVTHDIYSIPKKCQRIVLMREGKIVREDKLSNIIGKIDDRRVTEDKKG